MAKSDTMPQLIFSFWFQSREDRKLMSYVRVIERLERQGERKKELRQQKAEQKAAKAAAAALQQASQDNGNTSKVENNDKENDENASGKDASGNKGAKVKLTEVDNNSRDV